MAVFGLSQNGCSEYSAFRNNFGSGRNNPDTFKEVLTRMGIDGWRTLRMQAVEHDTTIYALAVEAFNDLLKKYGKRQSVETRQ
jgi:hypothetical protein